MQLLNQIMIQRPQGVAVIQLLQGDLAAIPEEHATDILIISAYPGSYVPVEKSLIAALDNKGLSIAELATHKAIDLRDQLGCWLSAPLDKAQQEQFHIRKILCFEPWQQSNDQASVVGNIFRCINTFAFNENNNVIAMPVLASGKQKVPFEKMLPAMLDASIFWMENGLPLTCIKLVLFSEAQAGTALPIFTRAKQQNELKQSVRNGTITGTEALKTLEITKQQQMPGEDALQLVTLEISEQAAKEKSQAAVRPKTAAPITTPGLSIPGANPPQAATVAPSAAATTPARPSITAPEIKTGPVTNNSSQPPPPATTTTQYDYFVSYAHKHAAIVDVFVNNLVSADKELQVFYDKSSIPTGGLWIKQISDAIQQSKRILIFLSPEYSNSPVCWDEFQCAKLVEYNSKKPMIQTIYLYNDATMPPIMGIYSWADCREGDAAKLLDMATQLIGPRL